MKKLLFILLFPAYLNAQSITVAPSSFSFWGQAKNISEISIDHKGIGIHYFKAFIGKKDVMEEEIQSSFAISYKPIRYKFFDLGGIINLKNFPTTNATKINFYLEFKLPINKVEITYKHISNGFGLLHHTNLGYDTISISLRI